jgi:exoribonuclease R
LTDRRRGSNVESDVSHAKKGRRHGKKLCLGENVRVMVTRINALRGEIAVESVQTSESSALRTPALSY